MCYAVIVVCSSVVDLLMYALFMCFDVTVVNLVHILCCYCCKSFCKSVVDLLLLVLFVRC